MLLPLRYDDHPLRAAAPYPTYRWLVCCCCAGDLVFFWMSAQERRRALARATIPPFYLPQRASFAFYVGLPACLGAIAMPRLLWSGSFAACCRAFAIPLVLLVDLACSAFLARCTLLPTPAALLLVRSSPPTYIRSCYSFVGSGDFD